MNIDPMSEGLVRQRRNAISIACVLIFLKFAQVQIDKFSFLGLDFGKLGNPPALYLAIWIFFLYFVFRYYQYFSQEGVGKLSIAYYEDLMGHVKQIAKSIDKNANFHPHQLITMKNEGWGIRVTYRRSEEDQLPEVNNIKYPIKSYRKHCLVSASNITLNSSVVTDYLLPFLLVVFAVVYCFHGSESCLVEAFANGFA
jgi:hypothetical protein